METRYSTKDRPSPKEQRNELFCKASVLVQKSLGLKAKFEAISVIRKEGTKEKVSGASKATFPFADGRLTGCINLPVTFESPRDEIETFCHENAHLIIEEQPETTNKTQNQTAVFEGICDLIGLDVTDQMLNEAKKEELIKERKGKYRRIYDQYETQIRNDIPKIVPYGPPSVIVTAEGEGPLHLLGRNFIYALAEKFPGISTATLFKFTLNNPPSLEELFKPEDYITKNQENLLQFSPDVLQGEPRVIDVYEGKRRVI